MLARTSRLRHPTGLTIETPLLIPSFSSKGFGSSPDHARSELERISHVANEFLTDSMLVSAYDLHHGMYPRLGSPITDITVVDSGGYETSDQQDLATVYVRRGKTLEWSKEKHLDELSQWPAHVPAIFVTWDRDSDRMPVTGQMDAAAEYHRFRDQQLLAFLARPATMDQRYLPLKEVVAEAERLGDFAVLGVTEKELGKSHIQRMESIAKLRLAMDDAGVDTPIHIFGCLDPISIPLYFIAGAEIFDGLAWLRYGFFDGVAMYRQNAAALRDGIHQTDDFVKMRSMQENLNNMIDLRNRLRRFLLDKDYGKLGNHAKVFREAHELLSTKEGRAA